MDKYIDLNYNIKLICYNTLISYFKWNFELKIWDIVFKLISIISFFFVITIYNYDSHVDSVDLHK